MKRREFISGLGAAAAWASALSRDQRRQLLAGVGLSQPQMIGRNTAAAGAPK